MSHSCLEVIARVVVKVLRAIEFNEGVILAADLQTVNMLEDADHGRTAQTRVCWSIRQGSCVLRMWLVGQAWEGDGLDGRLHKTRAPECRWMLDVTQRGARLFIVHERSVK